MLPQIGMMLWRGDAAVNGLSTRRPRLTRANRKATGRPA